MSLFSTIFGEDAGKGGGRLRSKIQKGAENQLQKKILRTTWYKWYLVYFRNWVLYPLIKLPFVPLLVIAPVFKMFNYFNAAERAVQDLGHNVGKIAYHDKKAFDQAMKKPIIVRPIAVVLEFFKTLAHLILKPAGSPIYAERQAIIKLLVYVIFAWTLSMIILSISAPKFLYAAFYAYYKISPFLHSFVTVLNMRVAIPSAQSSTFELLKIGLSLWGASVIFAALLTRRNSVVRVGAYKEFLIKNAHREDEIRTECTILALDELVFISSPSARKDKLRGIQTTYPGGFLPGEIYESVNRPGEVVMYKRPEKEKIIFGGTNSKKEILDLYPEYEGRIIKKMSGNIKKASDTELIFLGEVIDPAWWQSSHIFVELKSCPHLVIVGQTRSGKSKGLLSFCYGITAAYPETVWFFADGKGSPDYDDFAAYRSTFPVAKPDTDGDPLIQLANVIEAVWGYYSERKADFAKAGAAGKTCSTIYEYREKVEFIPQVFLVIDEFAAFVLEMDYESNSTKAGTIANRIRRLAAEAASYGIHLIIASQRYQGDNVPTSLRSNLTTRLVYNVQMSDANFLECPQSTRLTTGESYAYAPGLYSEHTGLNTVKVKLPYIGGDYMPLFKKHLKPIDPSLKKEFNKRLDYNKGGLNDALTISGLCLKLHRFLDCQDYVIKEKTKDFESSLLQMEVFKGQEVSGKSEFVQFGRNMKATSGVAIGISVIKPEDCHEDTFQEIQEENPNYPVIIVFVTGKTAAGSRQKFEKIEKTMNEKKTRFFFYSLSKFQRDMKNVEQNHKDGNRIDIIAQYLTGLGLSDASQSVAGAAIGWESINAKTPYKMIMSKLLRDLSLPIVSEEGLQIRGMPAIRVKLPAGWILTVIFSTEKNKRDDLRAIVQSQHALGHCSLIMTDERFPPGEIKYIESAHAAIWRLSELDQIREDAFQALAQKKAFVPARSIIYRLLSDLCIFREGSPIDFATEASITMDAELSSDGKKFKKVVIGCPDTRSVLYTYDDIAIEDFEMAALQLPLHLNVIVLNGLAPINAKKVTLAPGKGRQIINNIYFGGYHVERGILMQSEEEDSLAKEMLLKKLKGL